MPSVSEEQRAALYAKKGPEWVHEHHFDVVAKDGIPASVHYRKAESNTERCGTCEYFKDGVCTMYDNTPVGRGMVCDQWEGVEKAVHYLANEPPPPYEAPPSLAAMILTLEPLQKEHVKPVRINPLPEDSRQELARFWTAHPDMRQACVDKYGHDPINDATSYWSYGINEPSHVGVLAAIRRNGGTFTLELVKEWEKEETADFNKEIKKEGKDQLPTTAAGVAVRAGDTGRVLMLQRANTVGDLAAGTWEFPGGILNDGEHPYTGAKREWQEEMGHRFPKGKHVGSWKSGVYEGFVHEVPSEASVKLNLDPGDRRVLNPDDPDGDNAEVAAWFHPHHLRRMSGLRSELRGSRPWVKVAKELRWQDKLLKKLEEDDDEDELEKDVASGPAGDIPASGDVADIPNMPSSRTLRGLGPTISEVHVDRPLKNISINYAGKRRKLKVTKSDKYKQLIYGVVLEPNSLDSQDDYMMSDHVEKAAHTYMRKVVRGKASVSKLQHRTPGFLKEKPSVIPVESFIAPADFSYDGKETVKKGTWVMVLHVEDPSVWNDVLDGKYTGLSIGGTGIRQEMKLPVEGEWMDTQPADWFTKEATPQDFEQWRLYGWEGS